MLSDSWLAVQICKHAIPCLDETHEFFCSFIVTTTLFCQKPNFFGWSVSSGTRMQIWAFQRTLQYFYLSSIPVLVIPLMHYAECIIRKSSFHYVRMSIQDAISCIWQSAAWCALLEEYTAGEDRLPVSTARIVSSSCAASIDPHRLSFTVPRARVRTVDSGMLSRPRVMNASLGSTFSPDIFMPVCVLESVSSSTF